MVRSVANYDVFESTNKRAGKATKDKEKLAPKARRKRQIGQSKDNAKLQPLKNGAYLCLEMV